MKEYAEIHLKLNTEKYIDSANRILLILGTSSLFAADVSYHKSCYEAFRESWWKTKLENSCKAKAEANKEDVFSELLRLIKFHIIDKHEIYTLAQLRNFHEQIMDEAGNKSTLPSIDLKNKLIEKFGNKLKFMKSSHSSARNTSEYVMSSDESILPNCLSTVFRG